MKRIASVLLLCFAVLGCSEPDSYEMFVRSGDGPYEFPFTLSDTLATYDFSFYTRVDAFRSPSVKSYPATRLDVKWICQDLPDTLFSETVYFDAGLEEGTIQKYRKGVVPPKQGRWTIVVDIPNEPDGFCGLGLIVKRNKRYGSR